MGFLAKMPAIFEFIYIKAACQIAVSVFFFISVLSCFRKCLSDKTLPKTALFSMYESGWLLRLFLWKICQPAKQLFFNFEFYFLAFS